MKFLKHLTTFCLIFQTPWLHKSDQTFVHCLSISDRGKNSNFFQVKPLPIDRREKTSDHKPPEPRSRVACHPVTHLNLKTAAFSFIFCHFVATVFLLMRPLTINFCIVNAVQKLDPSHKLGMLMLSRRFSCELSPRWQTKEKHFIQKLKGSIKWRRGI